jgi:hypothetical protein
VVLDAVEVPPSLNADIVTYAAVAGTAAVRVTESNSASGRGCFTRQLRLVYIVHKVRKAIN